MTFVAILEPIILELVPQPDPKARYAEIFHP
jgi:hypothetical protein